jgi:hypothetical protein
LAIGQKKGEKLGQDIVKELIKDGVCGFVTVTSGFGGLSVRLVFHYTEYKKDYGYNNQQ